MAGYPKHTADVPADRVVRQGQAMLRGDAVMAVVRADCWDAGPGFGTLEQAKVMVCLPASRPRREQTTIHMKLAPDEYRSFPEEAE